MAAAAGLDQSGFRHRMAEREGMRFSVEELGAICAEAKAPTSWSFLPWSLAEKVDAILKLASSP